MLFIATLYMSDFRCIICETPVEEHGANMLAADMHFSCVEEKTNREQIGLCTMCGERLKPKDIDRGLLKHNGCNDPKKYSTQK